MLCFTQWAIFCSIILFNLQTSSATADKGCDGYWRETSTGKCSLTSQSYHDEIDAETYCRRKGGVVETVIPGSQFTCSKDKVDVQNCELIGNVDVTDLGYFTPYCVKDIPPTMYILRRNEGKVSLTYPNYLFQIEQLASDVPNWTAFTKRRTILVVHGYMDDSTTWVQDVANELLEVEDANVLMFDWKNGASDFDYLTSASNIRVMGRLLAVMMDRMVSLGLPETQIWCVGHSLGAQSCGAFGKDSYNTIDRITGLDPAAPGFDDYKDIQYRFNNQNARAVEVIHTGGNRDPESPLNDYGTLIPCGDADFYPNGGMDQPGCTDFENIEGCSHDRSHELFLETITSNECILGSWSAQNCLETTSNMGYRWDKTTKGMFYSVTRGRSAYCEGTSGKRLVDPTLPDKENKIINCLKAYR